MTASPLAIATTQPADIEELMQRADQLIGQSFGDLARCAGVEVPTSMRHAKGWAGQLIELYLGATAGSKQQQDFPTLGVELKTIPVSPDAKPLETTYVCITPLLGLNGVTWQQSNVRNKLQQVLWIPVDGRREVPIAERTVGIPILWQPSPEEDQLLRQDWEEISEQIILGQVESLTARFGTALQLRPKAADGSRLTDAVGTHGELIKTRPRGYYLRKEFTQQILLQGLQQRLQAGLTY